MDELREWQLREHGSSLDIALFVQPRAGRNATAGLYRGALKIRVTAPPVENAANQAVIDFFASTLKIPKSRMKIVSGRRSKAKILRIEGISRIELLDRLDMRD